MEVHFVLVLEVFPVYFFHSFYIKSNLDNQCSGIQEFLSRIPDPNISSSPFLLMKKMKDYLTKNVPDPGSGKNSFQSPDPGPRG
jgi:hypothetical protein